MKIKMTILFIFLITTFYKAQKSNTYKVEQLGWTIDMPNNFTNMNLIKQPVQVVDAKNNKEVNNASKTREKSEEVRFQGKNYTYFLVHYKKTLSGNKALTESTVKEQNDELIESFKKGQPEAQFESKTIQEKVDDINFYKTDLKMNLENNISQNFIIYRTILNGYEAGFTIFYVYPTSESDKLIKAFKNSKFKK